MKNIWKIEHIETQWPTFENIFQSILVIKIVYILIQISLKRIPMTPIIYR